MGVIPPPPPAMPMTDQQRSEARFRRQLDELGRRPRSGSWIRFGIAVSVIAWLIWAAGQASETFRAWLM